MGLDGTLDVTTDGHGVSFALAVTNASDEPITAQFSDGCRVDVAVEDDDAEVWRFTEERLFPQVLGEERFDPGETRRFEVEWADPDPGSYTATAELTATDRDCTASASFSV
ncbi:BsuPI-related putative proteinase inhibitor [Halovivax limisalsi]|uniref:BsuPI-related putative proteinase inhibitor n=1 Tax=Halovivax limisalsi TaxID=1453760 RepID=UPI001FFD6CFC|nr:BsuPI-related putative proteinase inhibitor [Halovivax limisalsi]